MATSGTISLTRSPTNSVDGYDHLIKLVDTTKVKNDKTQTRLGDPPESSGAPLSRKWTRDTLRKELAKRKYAKWQGGDDQFHEESEQTSTSINQHAGEEAGEGREALVTASNGDDFTSLMIQKQEAKAKKDDKRSDYSQNRESTIDILYENQRGWFLFGMPLYSANSLLNLDPAPWQTSTFQDSPVNITNAQVPDPSWQWAWKTWYVDMSHDVDEEGWEYSFSFQARFAWHGSHPWFHSFARRRRWLRKRIKVHPSRLSGEKGTMKDSHRLNADYFTIHGSRRDRSPDSSAEATLANRSSQLGYDGQESDSDQDPDDITNVIALLAVLKKATVDREKIVAVRRFLAQGGDELHYLADNMDEIMGLLIYQNSRQQLFDHLVQTLKETGESQAPGNTSENLDNEAVHRKIGYMTRAVDASRSYLKQLEYWTDATESERRGESSLTVPPAFGKDDIDWSEDTRAHIEEANTENQIQGIPKEADVDTAPSPLRTAHEQMEGPAGGSLDKGKGKEEG